MGTRNAQAWLLYVVALGVCFALTAAQTGAPTAAPTTAAPTTAAPTTAAPTANANLADNVKTELVEKQFVKHPFYTFIAIGSTICCLGTLYQMATDFICKQTEDEDWLPGNGGKLVITAHSAAGLPSTDTTNIDPYIVCSTGADGYEVRGTVHRSNVHVQGGANPSWEHRMQFNLTDADKNIVVYIYDADVFSKDDEVSRVSIPLVDLADEGELTWTEKDFQMETDVPDQDAGTIKLSARLMGNIDYLSKKFTNPIDAVAADTFDVDENEDEELVVSNVGANDEEDDLEKSIGDALGPDEGSELNE